MARNATISIHHIWFFILNNSINNVTVIHTINGIMLPNPNAMPRRPNTIPLIAPPKCMYSVILSDDLNHVATPTNDNPTPDKKKNTLSGCNVIVNPRDKQNTLNRILNGCPNSYHDSEIDGSGPLNLINKNNTYDIKIAACTNVNTIIILYIMINILLFVW